MYIILKGYQNSAFNEGTLSDSIWWSTGASSAWQLLNCPNFVLNALWRDATSHWLLERVAPQPETQNDQWNPKDNIASDQKLTGQSDPVWITLAAFKDLVVIRYELFCPVHLNSQSSQISVQLSTDQSFHEMAGNKERPLSSVLEHQLTGGDLTRDDLSQAWNYYIIIILQWKGHKQNNMSSNPGIRPLLLSFVRPDRHQGVHPVHGGCSFDQSQPGISGGHSAKKTTSEGWKISKKKTEVRLWPPCLENYHINDDDDDDYYYSFIFLDTTASTMIIR